MLVCSSEVGKLLPVNHWSNTAGNRESSSALLTFRIRFWGNKRGARPGWLGLLCYVAAHCRTAIPLNPRGCSHAVIRWCLHHHSVEGGGGRPDGTRRKSNSTLTLIVVHAHSAPGVGVMKWEKKRGRELCWDKLWLNVSEGDRWAELCGCSVRLDGTCYGPHTEGLATSPIRSYNFGFYALSELS